MLYNKRALLIEKAPSNGGHILPVVINTNGPRMGQIIQWLNNYLAYTHHTEASFSWKRSTSETIPKNGQKEIFLGDSVHQGKLFRCIAYFGIPKK